MDRGCFKVSVAWCCQRSKTEYLEADDGISSKALVGGHPPRSPLPPRLQTVAEAKGVHVSSRSSRLRIAA